MSRFHCPVCEEKIGAFQKYIQSTRGKGLIECPSCKNKPRLQKYGSGMANANLIIIFSHWVLGIKEQAWPLYILLWIFLEFVQKMRSPFWLYEPAKKARLPEWIIVSLSTTVLVIYFVIVIAL